MFSIRSSPLRLSPFPFNLLVLPLIYLFQLDCLNEQIKVIFILGFDVLLNLSSLNL